MVRMDLEKIIGCGLDSLTFKKKYDDLSEEIRQKLDRVAKRLWVTQKLHYEVNVNQFSDTDLRDSYDFILSELPALEIYLLCTCLDTMAGKSNVEFDKWLGDQEITKSLEVKEIGCLYHKYKKEYGIGSNLRALFENLHPIVF